MQIGRWQFVRFADGNQCGGRGRVGSDARHNAQVQVGQRLATGRNHGALRVGLDDQLAAHHWHALVVLLEAHEIAARQRFLLHQLKLLGRRANAKQRAIARQKGAGSLLGAGRKQARRSGEWMCWRQLKKAHFAGFGVAEYLRRRAACACQLR